MTIDSHTHISPDKIASKVEAGLRSKGLPVCGPMTLAGLKRHMLDCRLEAAITFCVAEKESVVKAANDFIISVNDGKSIYGFGTILPGIDNPEAEVRRLRDNGIKGIKFHASFQGTGVCDEAMFPIYEEMGNDLIAYFHSGKDPVAPEKPALTTPQGISKLKSLFPRLTIVAAHLGGHDMLDDVKQWILGKDIYIDTSWTPNILAVSPELVTEIVRQHGIRRVLFGTDYPTVSGPKVEIEWLKRLPLKDGEKARLFHDNAAELLK